MPTQRAPLSSPCSRASLGGISSQWGVVPSPWCCGPPERGRATALRLGRSPRQSAWVLRWWDGELAADRADGELAADRGRFPPGSRGAAGRGRAGQRPGCSGSSGWRPRATRRTRVRRDGGRGRVVSSRRSEVDRDLLGVTGADRRGATLIAVGSDHRLGSVEQHFPRLFDSAPACDHRGPLRHRPPVLIGGEHTAVTVTGSLIGIWNGSASRSATRRLRVAGPPRKPRKPSRNGGATTPPTSGHTSGT